MLLRWNTILCLLCLAMPTANAGLFESLTETVAKSVAETVTGNKTAPPPATAAPATSTATATDATPESLLKDALFGPSHVVYRGYARRFLPVKQVIYGGDIDQAVNFYNSKGKIALAPAAASWTAGEPPTLTNTGGGALKLGQKSLKFLNHLELGTLQLDSGDYAKSITSLQAAQKIAEKRASGGVVSGWLKKGASIGASVLGGGEYVPYEGEGFEKVLMLNYQSMGYMLKGDRGAYSVARRAMDWQRQEEKKFVENVALVNKQLANSNQAASWDKSGLEKNYEPYEKRAKRVASAFVNPFGWYIAGVVQEFDSYQDPSVWTNARGAYQKALDLTPDNQSIAAIIKEMDQRSSPKKDRNLLHVVVADGFVPEKKVVVSTLTLADEVIPLELPLYQPVPNPVSKVVLLDSRGNKLKTLYEVADIEALALRYQKDTQPMRKLVVALSMLRSTAQKQMESRSQYGGMASKALKSLDIQSPDTRSWMSLPGRLLANRVLLKPGTSSVQLVSYDQQGKELARRKIAIDPDGHNFVYGRNLGSKLLAYRADSLWI
jgi:hypothetical protein